LFLHARSPSSSFRAVRSPIAEALLTRTGVRCLTFPLVLATTWLAAAAARSAGPVVGWVDDWGRQLRIPAAVGVRGATAIATGEYASCAIQAGSGVVVCWGDDTFGQATPSASVDGTAGTAAAITAGGYYACAIQAGTGAVVCWGDPSNGQTTPPASVDGSLGAATAIAAGDDFTLAIVPEPAGGALDWAALGILLALGHWRSPRGRVARRP
jgi:hypothetical protein